VRQFSADEQPSPTYSIGFSFVHPESSGREVWVNKPEGRPGMERRRELSQQRELN